jgi:hypothetical protein
MRVTLTHLVVSSFGTSFLSYMKLPSTMVHTYTHPPAVTYFKRKLEVYKGHYDVNPEGIHKRSPDLAAEKRICLLCPITKASSYSISTMHIPN